jgi:uncharacterized membrane protein YphA (DoxX/SURF4 family)
MTKMQNWILLAGRIFLGLAIFGSGLLTITAWDTMLKEVSSSYIKTLISPQLMPTVLVAKVLIEVIGGICLCFGYRTKMAAGMVAALMAAKLVLFHDPLVFGGKSFLYRYSTFLDDAKILGGLLMAMVAGPGKHSIDKG